jgi:putative flippase GtrA
MKFINSDIIRFLVAGMANTTFSYLVYLLALHYVHFLLAFCLSFMSGILCAFITNSRFVFRTHLRWSKLWGVSAIYILQAFLGLILLTFWIEKSKIDKGIAPLLNIVTLTPATFVLNRWYLMRKEART